MKFLTEADVDGVDCILAAPVRSLIVRDNRTLRVFADSATRIGANRTGVGEFDVPDSEAAPAARRFSVKLFMAWPSARKLILPGAPVPHADRSTGIEYERLCIVVRVAKHKVIISITRSAVPMAVLLQLDLKGVQICRALPGPILCDGRGMCRDHSGLCRLDYCHAYRSGRDERWGHCHRNDQRVALPYCRMNVELGGVHDFFEMMGTDQTSFAGVQPGSVACRWKRKISVSRFSPSARYPVRTEFVPAGFASAGQALA